jgi:prepilin-type N-terminal cleavage/methylation domain-containing protein
MRQRGFTLVEVLIALGLAGLVVAGALQLHMAFHTQSTRQTEISEVQQTLRTAMAIIARSLRSAGTGMVTPSLTMAMCNPTSQPIATVRAFQWRNGPTSFADPVPSSGYDTTASDTNGNPDQFKVVASDDSTPYLATNDTSASVLTLVAPTQITRFAAHDLFTLLSSTGTTPTAMAYLREATAVSLPGSSTTPSTATVTHASPGSYYGCANKAGPDPDLTGLSSHAMAVRRFGPTSQTWFRILPASDSSNTTKTPQLQIQMSYPNKATANGTWQVLAEDIEDMQIAVVLDSGQVVNTNDDPTIWENNTRSVTAVRVTLVGRSPMKVQGLAFSQTGGYEDNPATTVNDGYIRRAVTEQIQLRNN